MNFAYIDTRGLLENVLGSFPPPVRVEPTPCTLTKEWTDFETELSKFKKEYAKARSEYAQNISILQERQEEVNVVKMMLENVSSESLRNQLGTIIREWENSGAVAELNDTCSVLAGKVEAMKKVLLDTNADRYAKFTCFVCMDRLVDLFIDPCGHVICEHCWTHTRDKRSCPGCRTQLVGTKKIFSMT